MGDFPYMQHRTCAEWIGKGKADRQPWTPAHDATLRNWLEAGFTHAQVGNHLRRTKDACIGRAHRLGIYVRRNEA